MHNQCLFLVLGLLTQDFDWFNGERLSAHSPAVMLKEYNSKALTVRDGPLETLWGRGWGGICPSGHVMIRK